MFYGMGFLTVGLSGKPIDRSEPVPAYSDFQRRFWAREVNLADDQAKTVYGKVHWEQLSQNVRQARFDEALRIVSDRKHNPGRYSYTLAGCSIKGELSQSSELLIN